MCPAHAVSSDKQPVSAGALSQGGCGFAHSGPSSADDCRNRVAAAGLELPPIPFPSRHLYALAGATMLRALVQRHYQRLLDSTINHLFPRDPERLAAAVAKTTDFIVEATGGPARLSAARGEHSLLSQHLPFAIDEAARAVWLAQLLSAMDDVGFPDELRLEFWNWLEAMSIHLINAPALRAQPVRYPLAEAPIALFPFMAIRRRSVMCPR